MSPHVLQFSALPKVPLYKLALARKPGLKLGDIIPPIEGRVEGLRLDGDGPYREVVGWRRDGPLPLAFPFVFAAPLHKALLVDPRFPLPGMGMVHMRQTLRAERPLQPGEVVDLVVSGGEWRPARKGVEFDLVTRLEVRGQTIWSGTTTALSPKGPGHGQKVAHPPLPEPQGLCDERFSVPENMGRRYAKVSGDFNPIHWHALTARPFGFKRAIVHGMWTLAACLARLGDSLPTAGVTVRCDFLKPVVLPSEVHFRAGKRAERPGEEVLQMRLDLANGAALVADIS